MSKKIVKVAGVIEPAKECSIKKCFTSQRLSSAQMQTILNSAKSCDMESTAQNFRKDLGIDTLMDYEIEDEPVENVVNHFNTLQSCVSQECDGLQVEQLLCVCDEFQPYSTIAEYVDEFKSGDTTPKEVCETLISLSTSKKVVNLNFLQDIDKKYIIEQAVESTKRYKEGCPLSVIDGVPFVVSSQIATAHFKCNFGMKTCDKQIKPDSYIVKRLLECGAILIGTTKIGYGGLSAIGINPSNEIGSVKNPYNKHCYCSGASTGSSAAVSSGFVPFAVGVDGMGSGLLSAGHCGATAFRATQGRVFNDEEEQKFSFQSPIVISVSAQDAAVVCKLISDSNEILTNDFKFPQLTITKLATEPAAMGKLKVAFDTSFMSICTDELALSSINTLRKRLSKFFEIIDYSIPEVEESIVAARTICLYEYANGILKTQNRASFMASLEDANFAALMAVANSITKEEYTQALKQRNRAFTISKEIFTKADVLLLPLSAVPAQTIKSDDNEVGVVDTAVESGLTLYCSLSTLVGLPSMVTYLGVDHEHRPMSLLCHSNWFDDNKLFNFGNLLDVYFSPEQRDPHKFVHVL